MIPRHYHVQTTLGSFELHALTQAQAVSTALAQPEPEVLAPGYIDPEHKGQDRELLEVLYRAWAEGCAD